MPLQPSHFHRLPPTERIQELAAFYRQHSQDIASFMWHILPVAVPFGERV